MPAPTKSDAISELVEGARAAGIVVSPTAVGQFERYIDTLLLWRSRMSLTTASTATAIVRDHILDSLSVYGFVQPGYRVADLGSGAGFPGVPLAILCPAASVILVEPRRKRANFLREVLRQTQLDNGEVIEQRARDLGRSLGGQFDLVVSRAVWSGNELMEANRPLLKAGGQLVAMKGPTADVHQPTVVGFSGPDVVHYTLRQHVRRMLLVYVKV